MKATFLLVFLAFASFARAADKDDATSLYVAIIQQIQQLGRSNHIDSAGNEIRVAVDKLLPEALSSVMLYRLGVSTYLVAFPQEVGDVRFDWAFDDASHRCAYLLAGRTDDESIYFLHQMQPICGPDGGEHLYYEKLIERQGQLRARSRPK